MKKLFFSDSKQTWQRLFFSFLGACFIWWYVYENLMTVKIFSDVPVYVRNIPPGKTIVGMKKEIGRLNQVITLTLKGRKRDLDRIENDQIEVAIDATDRDTIWNEKLSLDNLRCFNPDIVLKSAITSISHTPLQIHISGMASRDVPLQILKPHGSLPKGYMMMDYWPQRLYQHVEGAEDSLAILRSKQLSLSFDLNRISKQELDKASEHFGAGSEFFFKVPDNWKMTVLPPPFAQEPQKLDDPDAQHLMLFVLKPSILPLPQPLLISISHLPLPKDQYSVFFNEQLMKKNAVDLYWTSPIYVQDVSAEFLTIIAPHLQMNVYIGQKGNGTVSIEAANILRAERKYCEFIMQSHPEIFKGIEQTIKKQLQSHFWQYLRKMTFLNEKKRPLQFEVSIKDQQLFIEEEGLS